MPPLILQTVLVRQNQQGTQYRLPGRSSLPRSCELSSHQTPIRTWNLPFSICPFPKKKKKRKFIRRKKKKKMGKKRAHGPTCIASGSSPNAPTLFVTTQIPGSEVDLSNSKFLSGWIVSGNMFTQAVILEHSHQSGFSSIVQSQKEESA
eukprot:TRINITY_DN133_c0_g1_i1.p2 TRINITY_DN133_c0_g1~~TRINITY_DN133_c0_g1_i1.p2  ORF type:complete len:149 (+),score=7.84 TRINITY_DN133_c0_g1_i1:277-723(+)